MPNIKPRPERRCANPNCDNVFAAHNAQQKYCSRECIQGKGRNHLVCPCGTSTGSYQKKYCCPDHHDKYKRVKAPVKIISYVCQNPKCGKDFERPHFYPNKKMFCSTACSNQEHSRKRQQHFKFGGVNLNSGFELRFVACMERLKIDWSPWPDDRPFDYEVDGKPHTYTPDFLVEGKAIEVKGWDHPNSYQPLAREIWDETEPLVLVNRERLNELEHIFNPRTALDYLSIDCTVPLR